MLLPGSVRHVQLPPTMPPPAHATRISSRPSSVLTLCSAPCRALKSVRPRQFRLPGAQSHARLRPCFLQGRETCARLGPTSAPCWASDRPIALPIPRLPPVMTLRAPRDVAYPHLPPDFALSKQTTAHPRIFDNKISMLKYLNTICAMSKIISKRIAGS